MKYGISALALAAVLALSACSQPVGSQSDTPTCCKIGISFPTTALAYRQKMLDLLKQYDQAHPEVEFLIYDGESSQQKQNRDMLDMLENSVQGIILIPFTMEGPIPVIHYANEKNVPVLTLDNDVPLAMWDRIIRKWGGRRQSFCCDRCRQGFRKKNSGMCFTSPVSPIPPALLTVTPASALCWMPIRTYA